MRNALHQQGQMWLEKGISSARAGRRSEAREALFRALNDESQREMAWLWLAAVADDRRQERLYLEKVLALNPDNQYAKSGLEQLAAKERPEGSQVETVALESGTPFAPASGGAVPPAASGASVKGSEPDGSTSSFRAVPRAGEASVSPTAGTVEIPHVAATATSERQNGERRPEPSGWTMRTPPVKPRDPANEPSGWTRATPRVAPARPAVAPAQRLRAAASAAGPHYPDLKPSLVWTDLFGNHENWTVTMAALSLVLLALLLICLAAVTAVTG